MSLGSSRYAIRATHCEAERAGGRMCEEWGTLDGFENPDEEGGHCPSWGVSSRRTVPGISCAASADSPGSVFHGCVNPGNDVLRVIDPSAGQECHSSETAITWNQEGPQSATQLTVRASGSLFR